MKRVILILILFVTGIALNGCTSRYEKVETQEFTPSPDGKKLIKIENTSGDIKVVKNDEEKIRIIATLKTNVRKKDLDKPIEDIRVNLIENGSELLLQTEMSDNRHGFSFSFNENKKVDYLIFVPARLEVNVDNVNGDIEITDIEGELNLNLVNGNIKLNNPTGLVNAELINGNITSNISSTKGIKINTINGKITMGLSKDLNAKVIADISNGKVVTEDMGFTNSYDERNHFTGTLGTGGYEIRLETVNGKITLEKIDDQSPTVSGNGSKEEKYMKMKEEFEKAQEDLKKAEENLRDAEEEYYEEKASEKNGTRILPNDTVKSDSTKTL